MRLVGDNQRLRYSSIEWTILLGRRENKRPCVRVRWLSAPLTIEHGDDPWQRVRVPIPYQHLTGIEGLNVRGDWSAVASNNFPKSEVATENFLALLSMNSRMAGPLRSSYTPCEARSLIVSRHALIRVLPFPMKRERKKGGQ